LSLPGFSHHLLLALLASSSTTLRAIYSLHAALLLPSSSPRLASFFFSHPGLPPRSHLLNTCNLSPLQELAAEAEACYKSALELTTRADFPEKMRAQLMGGRIAALMSLGSVYSHKQVAL